MIKVKSLCNRRRLIGASLMIPLLAIAIWLFNTRSTSAQGGFASTIFTVTPSGPALPTSATPGFTFQVTGDITAANERGQLLPGNTADKVGTFYRSGVVMPGGVSLVTDVYVLTKFNGAITASGVLSGPALDDLENADLLVVNGGVGTFRTAFGEAQVIPYPNPNPEGKFAIWLEEVPRR